jgi:hypothetical protein
MGKRSVRVEVRLLELLLNSHPGHFGDSIQYVNKEGKLQTIRGATGNWGCSHNTGIALAAADAPPYASVCAEDHTGIWLNTKTQGMSGTKISNEVFLQINQNYVKDYNTNCVPACYKRCNKFCKSVSHNLLYRYSRY